MTERHDSLEDGRSGHAPVGLAILVSLGVLAWLAQKLAKKNDPSGSPAA